MTKLRILPWRNPGLSRRVPNAIASVLKQERQREVKLRQKRRQQRDQGGRDWGDKATNQEMQVATRAERGKEQPC